jgi:3'-phosphoadenosine 5'-phosphosulfate sulfotransferase (PAPS reductase)/FAD synthetase
MLQMEIRIMNNIINISGGNDSVAMLQWVVENRSHFVDEKFTAIYCNTGWAIS